MDRFLLNLDIAGNRGSVRLLVLVHAVNLPLVTFGVDGTCTAATRTLTQVTSTFLDVFLASRCKPLLAWREAPRALHFRREAPKVQERALDH